MLIKTHPKKRENEIEWEKRCNNRKKQSRNEQIAGMRIVALKHEHDIATNRKWKFEMVFLFQIA